MGRRPVQIQLDVQQLTLLILGTTLFSGGLFAAGFVLGRDRRPPPFELQAPVLKAQPEIPKRALPLGEVEFLFPASVGEADRGAEGKRAAFSRGKSAGEKPASSARGEPASRAHAQKSKEGASPIGEAKKTQLAKAAHAKETQRAKRKKARVTQVTRREPVLSGGAKERARIQRRLAEIRAQKRRAKAPAPAPPLEDEDAPPA